MAKEQRVGAADDPRVRLDAVWQAVAIVGITVAAALVSILAASIEAFSRS